MLKFKDGTSLSLSLSRLASWLKGNSLKPVICALLVLLILGTFLSTFFFVPPVKKANADANWLFSWSNRKQITISNTNVDADLANFPVLINIAESGGGNTNIGYNITDKTNGYDIRFTDSNGTTLLSYEKESFSVASNNLTANFWVKIPSITHASGAVIYVYYGNSANTDWTAATSVITNCTTITNAQCVWKEGASQNFAAVYHLKETGSGSSSDYKDSTANSNNSGQATAEPTATSLGKVAGAQSFNGSTNYISLPNAASIKPVLPITVSAFVKSSNVTAFSGILTNDDYKQGGTSSKYYGIELDQSSAGKLRASFGDGTTAGSSARRTKTGTTGMSINTWYHVAFVMQGATNMSLYLNGVDDGGAYTGTGGSLAYSTAQGRIGEMDGNLRFAGIMDELRVSNVVRPAEWIKFEDHNISDSGNNLTFAAQENAPAGFVVSEVTPVSTPTNSTTPSYTFNSTSAGTITYGGDCTSATTAATSGNNTVTFNTLAAGTHSNCTIYVTDISSNQSNTLSISPFTIDLTAPTISSITTTAVNGTYSAGSTIPITVNFSEAVTSTGNVTVTLNTTPSRTCTFTISNATSGSCTYTVQSGDSATGLNTTISGTIADQATNAMSNFTPASNLSASKTINIGSLTAPVDLTQPVPLIVDTDMNTDYDDPFALAVANALAQQGKAKLLAVVINVNSTYGAPTASVINSWWGHSTSTIPIGVYLGSLTGGGAYEQQITSTFGVSGDTKSNYPSALTVYRQTLANAADNSVVIDSIGTLTNLQALLQSSADGISSLTGLQLVTQKVRRLVVMGGEYPSGSEHNFAYSSYASAAASYVMANWPTEVVVDGYNFGVSVLSHPSASRNINTDPLAEVWNIMTSPGAGHNSWDPLNTFYSITGLSTNFTAAGISGINTVNSSTGANSWASPGLGNVTYLGKAVSDATLGATLNSIVDTIPIIISSISSGSPASTGATITWTTSGTNTVTNGNWVSTSISTNSEVDYGLTSSYTASSSDASAVSSHSVALSSLSPSTTYHYRVKSTYSDGSYSVSDDQTLLTAANVPDAPTVNAPTISSLNVIINQNNNPANTEYAISCDSDTTFLNYTTNACEAISDDANHWRTYTSWGGAGGFTDTGLGVNTSHTYKAEARNGEGAVTALSSGATAYTLGNAPTAPTVNATSTTSLTVIINPNSNPAGTLFAIQNVTSDQYVKADGTLQAGEVWQNWAVWGGDAGIANTGLNANTQYNYKVKARNGDNINTALSGGAAKYTGASNPGATTATALSSVSIKVDWTSGGAQNKFNVYQNGQSGAGTLVHSANDLTYTDGGLTASTAYTYYVYSVNEESVENPNFTSATVSTQATPSPEPTPSPTPSFNTTTTSASEESATSQNTIKTKTDNTSPTANVNILQDPSTFVTGKSITFDATGSTDNVKISRYEWDFGDGKSSNMPKVNHQYEKPGRYTVTLTVYDKAGNKSVTTETIDIKPSIPTITNITAKGTALWIEGNSDPDTIVYLTIHSDPYNIQALADNKGYWTYSLADASETLGQGSHAILATASVKLADNSELRGQESKTYDFNLTVDNGKLKVEMKKTKIWQYISLGLILLIVVGFVLKRFRKGKLINRLK